MPVLSDSLNPGTLKGHRTIKTGPTTFGIYLLFALVVLFTILLRTQQQKRRGQKLEEISSKATSRKQLSESARTMQTPPSSSALREKPFIPDLESALYKVGRGEASENPMDMEKSQSSAAPENSELSSPVSESPQPILQNDMNTTSSITSVRPKEGEVQTQPCTPLPLSTSSQRQGSLLHPEPPSPTLSLNKEAMKLTTKGLYNPSQEYHFEDARVQGQDYYFDNEILFVPSPTEYTSFEALYSKHPPPIYHGSNPISYTSMSSSDLSDKDTLSYSTSSFSGSDETSIQYPDLSIPRRRSYTKTLSNGSEMSGEIVISAGSKNDGTGTGQWRRHTRVFGGQTCMACEENSSRKTSL